MINASTTVTAEIGAEYFWPDLPSHIQAETTILGAMLLDNSAYDEAKSLTADDFLLESHRIIWAAMVGLLPAADIVTLSNVLAAQIRGDVRDIQAVGGVAYLASLTEGLPRNLSIAVYVGIVQEKARLRRIIACCEQAIGKCHDQAETAAHIVTEMGKSLRGIKR